MRRMPTFAVLLALSVVAAHAATSPETRLQTVTLITGDQVSVATGKPSQVSLQPRKGRERIRFITHSEPVGAAVEQHLYVIPEDAAALIAAGRLDRQLFDVTELLESQYDDGSRDTLPLIVTYHEQLGALSASNTSIAAASRTRELRVVNGLAANARKQDIGALWNSLAPAPGVSSKSSSLGGTIKKVWLDRLIKPVLDRSVPQIGAPAAWAQHYEGNGVRVAVVDTGIDSTHPDLVGKVIADRNFTAEPNTDEVGHGTHVASIIAGSGAASNGKYRGVAPGAELISAKVCEVSGCSFSAIIEGIQWAVTEEGAKIVNLSLGGVDDPEVDPLEEAVNQLTESYGALFVVAAGNFGGRPFTVDSPASADAALAVGSVDKNDVIASSSGTGPRLGDKGVKPEITAPGVAIVAARAAGTKLGTPVGDSYVVLSGTSMATPHVAGAAALLAQLHPEFSAAQLKSVLMGSARFTSFSFPFNPVFSQGAGRVDVAAAFATKLISEPASLNLGTVLWPHDDDTVVTRVVTYRNTDATPTTLHLRVEAATLEGAAAGAGLFSLDQSTLTLAPGGSASVTFTVNTRVATPDGIYGGRIIATGDGVTITTPFSIEREVESYDISLSHIDLNGLPTPLYFTSFIPLDQSVFVIRRVFFGSPETTLRVPAGRYSIDSQLLGLASTILIKPVQVINSPLSLTFDARQASPIELTSPTATAERFWMQLGIDIQTSLGPYSSALLFFGPGFPGIPAIYTGTLGDPSPVLRSYLSAQWNDFGQAGGATDNAPLYAATWAKKGQLVTGPTLTIKPEKVAAVRSQYGSAFPVINQGSIAVGTAVGNSPSLVVLIGQSIVLPSRRTEFFYSTGDTVSWSSALSLPVSDGAQFSTGRNVYKPQRLYFAHWNEPPFAPAFPDHSTYALRSGDQMLVRTPLFGDRGNHAGFVGNDAHISLYRNGEKIGDAEGFGALFDVSPELATYRVEASAAQSAFALSSRVSAAWTFRSEHVDPATEAPLPLMSVRFEPRLNDLGQAPRGAHFEVPVSVWQNGQRGEIVVSNLVVEASYNDGASWQRVAVRRHGMEFVALLKHPLQGDFVSLRATARDLSSNGVEQTVIRAYGLGGPVKSSP